MGLMNWIKEAWHRVFLRRDAEKIFNVEIPPEGKIDGLIKTWYEITAGNPPWVDKDDDIKSINFAQFIDDVTSGLVTLDIGISLPDTPRGKYLQKIADYALEKMDGRVSDALGNAGIVFKPNGENVDFYKPGDFIITDWDSNHNPLGMIFVSKKHKGKKIYAKFEYHRFENTADGKVYAISNRAFVSESENSRGEPCKLGVVPEWEELEHDVFISDVGVPQFGYYGNPKPNFIERDSPFKIPIWENCTEELKALDIAWSRMRSEIEDSKHITIVPEQAIQYANGNGDKLPRFIKGLQMSGGIDGQEVHEHVATVLTEQRIQDINSILALISTKLGFDQGFFVLNEKTGAITATQVEADDQSTIRTIKNLRDPLRDALIRMLYGANVFADLYTDIPKEPWTENFDAFKEEISGAFNFGDITYSYEEDKANWWKYRIQGDVPPALYYQKFEGMSEDEARAMVEAAQPKEPRLFGEEE